MPAQSSRRTERRLTLLLIATGSIFAFIATIAGAITLANLSGISVTIGTNLFPAHPYLQVFGFLAEFVMGVGYSLIPRFKGKPIPGPSLGYLAYALLTAGNILVLLSVLQSAAYLGGALASILFLAASVIFASQVTLLATHPGGGFPEANPLIILSVLSFILTTVLLFLEQTGILTLTSIFSPQILYLSLFGFVGSEIYAVELRSVFIRLSDYRKRSAKTAWISQALAVVAAFLSVFFFQQTLLALSSLLFLIATLSLLYSIKILQRAHPLMANREIPKTHHSIVRYNEISMLLASGWLIIGSLLGFAWLALGANEFYIRDSFIHTIAIGFIASTILSFAPLLLPSILAGKGPSLNLSLGPTILLSLGVLLRVAGDLQTVFKPSLPAWESISGILILAAMIWFLILTHQVSRRRTINR